MINMTNPLCRRMGPTKIVNEANHLVQQQQTYKFDSRHISCNLAAL